MILSKFCKFNWQVSGSIHRIIVRLQSQHNGSENCAMTRVWRKTNSEKKFPLAILTRIVDIWCMGTTTLLMAASTNSTDGWREKDGREEKSNWFELRKEINKFISSRYENKFSQHEIWWISIIDIFIVSSAAFSRWLLDNLNIELFFGNSDKNEGNDEKWKV